MQDCMNKERSWVYCLYLYFYGYCKIIFREKNIQTQLYNQDILQGGGSFIFENIQERDIRVFDRTEGFYFGENKV